MVTYAELDPTELRRAVLRGCWKVAEAGATLPSAVGGPRAMFLGEEVGRLDKSILTEL